jgi:excisionase family DNA binding protein
MANRSSLSPREASRLLGIRLDTLYQKLWAGKIPASKVDGRWRIPSSAIQKRRLKVRQMQEEHGL